MAEITTALVRELQRDGRVSYQRLAELLGVSREAVRARVHRLTAAGTVRVVGIVRPSVVGIAAVAHVSLNVEGPARPGAGSGRCTSGSPPRSPGCCSSCGSR